MDKEQLLRLPAVLQQVQVGKSTWWAWCKQGYAPKPVKLGKRVSCWKASEIQAFIEQIAQGGANNA